MSDDIGNYNDRARERFPNFPPLWIEIENRHGTDAAIWVGVILGGDDDIVSEISGASYEGIQTHFGMTDKLTDMLFADKWKFDESDIEDAVNELVELSEYGFSEGEAETTS